MSGNVQRCADVIDRLTAALRNSDDVSAEDRQHVGCGRRAWIRSAIWIRCFSGLHRHPRRQGSRSSPTGKRGHTR
jgi:hypothetical protein